MERIEKITLEGRCSLCGAYWYVDMTEEEYDRWRFEDDLIQNILPNHTPEERECLISGMCPNCQNKIFDKIFGEFDEEEG